jgi:hypothetical protein
MKVAECFDKIRINPGNFGKSFGRGHVSYSDNLVLHAGSEYHSLVDFNIPSGRCNLWGRLLTVGVFAK